MIKVSVLYPNEPGKIFDMSYYLGTHIPLVKKLLGKACTNTSVEKGISGGAPGSPATYTTMGHLYFDKVQDFVDSFTPHAVEITGDLPNFTDITPVLQISEVMT